MKTVAVLGGGPAGAFAAERCARAGWKAVLFDEKLAWEKPCGGGITYKAYHRYPFLLHGPTARKFVHQTAISAPGAGAAPLELSQPLLIFSRKDLNQALLDRAAAAGADLEQTRVLGLQREGPRWRVRTKMGELLADFCILAMGARNSLRDYGTQWHAGDTMLALGYYVPGTQMSIEIAFLPKLQGYIWIFPRCKHLSVGICGKGEPAQALRQRLERFMAERGMATAGATFYSHVLPALERVSWRHNRVAGDGWLAVGDAAGLVDPITGEGLYYAMRSGDLAGEIVADDAVADKAARYRASVDEEFTQDLAFASLLAKRVYGGRFPFGSVPRRMVEFTRRSERFRDVMQDLVSGTQPYLTLRDRLLRNLTGGVRHRMMKLFLDRVIPDKLTLSQDT